MATILWRTLIVALVPGSVASMAVAQNPKKSDQPPSIVRVNNVAPPVAPPPVITPLAPISVTISRDGQALLLTGALGSGSAKKTELILQAAPSVRTIVLNSGGGLLVGGLDIAALVAKRQLDTYVEESCQSACTIILLAGRDRAASPNARIGFHRPIFPLSKAEDLPTLLSVTRSIYDEAGVDATFTDKVYDTPTESMWFPSTSELKISGVLTRVTLGGEISRYSTIITSRESLYKEMSEIPFWKALETKFPDIASDIMKTAWLAKQQGKNDRDFENAIRSKLIENIPIILSKAPDDVLIDYLRLVVDQLQAARAVSFEACDLYNKGMLNVGATLPPDLATREIALLQKAIEAQGVTAPPDETAALKIMEPMYSALPADQLEAVADETGNYTVSTRCNGMLNLYKNIQKAERSSQAIVARWLFSAGASK